MQNQFYKVPNLRRITAVQKGIASTEKLGRSAIYNKQNRDVIHLHQDTSTTVQVGLGPRQSTSVENVYSVAKSEQTNALLRALINLVLPTIIWVRGPQLLLHLQTAITMNLLQMPLNIDGLLRHHTAAILLISLQFLQPHMLMQ